MYLRITRGRFDPAKYDDLMRLTPDIATAIRRLSGCQGYQGGIDRNAGKTVAVSTWDTSEQAQFSRDALGDVIGRLHALGVQLDPPEFYELPPEA